MAIIRYDFEHFATHFTSKCKSMRSGIRFLKVEMKTWISCGALLALILSLTACLWAPEDTTFAQQAADAAAGVGEILVRHGVCEHPHKHCAMYIFSLVSIHGGFSLAICGVTNPTILAEAKEVVTKEFNATPAMTKVDFGAYAGSRTEACPGWGRKIISRINLRRAAQQKI